MSSDPRSAGSIALPSLSHDRHSPVQSTTNHPISPIRLSKIQLWIPPPCRRPIRPTLLPGSKIWHPDRPKQEADRAAE